MPGNNHPPSFACPLTMEIMEDPVMDLCAHNFERKAISAWLLKNSSCCPISRKPLTTDDLVPNHTLAERIEKWKWQREQGGIDWEQDERSSSEDEDATSTVTTDVASDIELGIKRAKAKVHPKKKKRRHIHYESVPAEFMLLPQERQLLETVRTRAAEDRALQRQKRCRTMTISLFISVAALTAMGAALAKYVLNQDE